jgi:hypothetical protein
MRLRSAAKKEREQGESSTARNEPRRSNPPDGPKRSTLSMNTIRSIATVIEIYVPLPFEYFEETTAPIVQLSVYDGDGEKPGENHLLLPRMVLDNDEVLSRYIQREFPDGPRRILVFAAFEELSATTTNRHDLMRILKMLMPLVPDYSFGFQADTFAQGYYATSPILGGTPQGYHPSEMDNEIAAGPISGMFFALASAKGQATGAPWWPLVDGEAWLRGEYFEVTKFTTHEEQAEAERMAEE